MIIRGYWNQEKGYVVQKTRHPEDWRYVRNALIASRVIDKTKEGRSIFLKDEYLVVYSDWEGREILRVPRFPHI